MTQDVVSFQKVIRVKETQLERAKRYLKNKRMRLSKTGKKQKRPKIPRESLSHLKKRADSIFSLFIRRRDGFRCLTPDALCKGPIQASHLLKRSYYDIRWDEKNVFAQCKHHNYNHDQGFRPSPQILTNYFLTLFSKEEYQSLVEKTKIKYTASMIREKALEVIQKYGAHPTGDNKEA